MKIKLVSMVNSLHIMRLTFEYFFNNYCKLCVLVGGPLYVIE